MFDEIKELFLKKLLEFIVWILNDPKELFNLFSLFFIPFLIICAIFSWKLRNAILQQKVNFFLFLLFFQK